MLRFYYLTKIYQILLSFSACLHRPNFAVACELPIDVEEKQQTVRETTLFTHMQIPGLSYWILAKLINVQNSIVSRVLRRFQERMIVDLKRKAKTVNKTHKNRESDHGSFQVESKKFDVGVG